MHILNKGSNSIHNRLNVETSMQYLDSDSSFQKIGCMSIPCSKLAVTEPHHTPEQLCSLVCLIAPKSLVPVLVNTQVIYKRITCIYQGKSFTKQRKINHNLNRKQNIHELLSSTEIKLYLHMKWCATCCLYMINNLISLGHVQYKKCL